MCTMIAKQMNAEGAGKDSTGWFKVNKTYVSYDHPFRAPFDHSLNIDFVNDTLGLDSRISVELSTETARALVDTINEVLMKAEIGGHIV